MSKYSSVCTAINLVEACDKLMSGNGRQSERTQEVISDLRDIAKDIRYGGQWDGSYEAIASALGYCEAPGTNCAICPYHKVGSMKGCTASLKSDAAAVIRHMEAKLKEARTRAAEV